MKMGVQKIILCLIALHLTIILNAQTYNFTNYNVADGLEQSDILSISQASNGYLLYGSNGGGLGVYDGYSFKSIKEKHGLSNNIVVAVDVLNSTGEIWAATFDGISLLNSKATEVLKNFAKGQPFYCVKTNKKGEVWFGSGKGLYVYNQNKDSVEYYDAKDELLNNSNIQTLYFDASGNLWIGTKNAGVFSLINGEVTNYSDKNGLTSPYVKSIIEGKKGEFLIGTVNGLCLIKDNKVSIIDLPKIEGTFITFTSSTYYRNKIVLGALNNQIYFIDKDNYKVSFIGAENGFNHPKIWSVFSDNESNLWLGSRGTGLVKYNPIFTYYNSSNGLLSDYIFSVYEDKEKNLFLGFNGGGLNIITKENKLKTIEVKDLGFSYIYHITEYKGIKYLGSNSGLFKFIDDKTYPIYFDDPEKKHENIFYTYKYKNQLLVGGKSGLYTLRNDTLFQIKNSPKEAIYNIINYKGAIYLAVDKGVYKYDNQKFEFITREQGLTCDRARSFKVDSKNNLWIATTEGVFKFNGKDFKKIDEASGLTSENIYFIEIDDIGNMWLGSNKGLDRLKIESAYQHWNNAENKIEVRNYGKNEGFNGVECNLNAVYRNKQNQLYFGTINGLYIYHADNDKINKQAPNLSINNVKLNFEDVDWNNYSDSISSETKLPTFLELVYNNNNLIFEYVGVSLTNPQDVQYQHKLEGLNEDWLPVSKDRKAVYTAIPPGKYIFKLKAKNSDGVWVENEQTFAFTILPPWWQTTWFYISVIIFVIALGYVIIVVRTRNLKKAQIVLTSKVEERTKELREEKEKVESANTELATQKKVIEIANKNITDSINYAKRIQEAILPKATKLDELKDSVSVLYMPKDVVSGDFYWFERVGNKLIFAAADCTGHGVPGAFMSMIGVNNLNQIVLESNITSPDLILKELNIAIKKALKQEDADSESKDGMDISISCFDLDKNVISYSGAFRPLIYIRNNELFELKASRQPIGGSAPIDFEYELNEFEFIKEDVFYMFSDGYPDQFGGPKGKKFMNKRLKDIFINIYSKTPLDQKDILKEELVTWMGDHEQIDDILVMCIKI